MKTTIAQEIKLLLLHLTSYSKIIPEITKCNLLKASPAARSGSNLDHAGPNSLEMSKMPRLAASASTNASNSLRVVCFAFSAIAPTACAAATLVSQLLLLKY